MAFCSELVMRGVFETVQMSFLEVGHTHEDVDALFSKVNMGVRHKEVATLLTLMAEVWECQKGQHPVPRLIQEVAAYKDYLKKFCVKEVEGQSKPCAFLFSMKDNVPVYQYKYHVKDAWMPIGGRSIWGTDPETNELIFPRGEPLAKPIPQFHGKAIDVKMFLNGYIKYLKSLCDDETSELYQRKFPLVRYWEKIAEILSNDLRMVGECQTESLKCGFWPRTNHGTGVKFTGESSHFTPAKDEDIMQNADMIKLQNEAVEEMVEQARPFVGSRSERAPGRWIPLHDIEKGTFLFLNPEEDWEKENGKGHFWLVRAMGPVDPNHEVPSDEGLPKKYAPMFPLQWWRPKCPRQTVDEKVRYKNCTLQTKTWERDPGYNEDTLHWQLASAAMYGFKSGMKEENLVERGLRIPPRVLNTVKEYMRVL